MWCSAGGYRLRPPVEIMDSPLLPMTLPTLMHTHPHTKENSLTLKYSHLLDIFNFHQKAPITNHKIKMSPWEGRALEFKSDRDKWTASQNWSGGLLSVKSFPQRVIQGKDHKTEITPCEFKSFPCKLQNFEHIFNKNWNKINNFNKNLKNKGNSWGLLKIDGELYIKWSLSVRELNKGSMGPGESELKQSRLMWSIIPVTNVKLSVPRVVAQEGAFPYQKVLPPSSTEEKWQNSTILDFCPSESTFYPIRTPWNPDMEVKATKIED